MSSLLYLIITGLKNRLLEVLHKPGKLVLYLIVILAIVGVFVMSLFTRQTVENFADAVWLKGIIVAFITIVFIFGVMKALKSGDAIFDMSDVNLLFVSPIRAQSILLYGLVRMVGMSFLAGFFILFQGNSLGMWFGLYFDDILMIFFGYILALILMQILSLIIYSNTNGNPRRKNIVKLLAFVLFVPMLAVGVYEFTQTGDIMRAAYGLLTSPVTSFTPIVGWASQGIISYVNGDAGGVLLFFGLIIVSGGLLVIYILKSNPDYYEDVLVASETAFARKRDLADGQVSTLEAGSTRKIKVAATGIGGGGASTFFYKHLRESFRANRFGLWGMSSIITVASGIALAVFFASIEDELKGDVGMAILLGSLLWTQIFTVGTGRGLKELYNHYIYLVPEPPFSKIVWSNLEVVFKTVVESAVLFTVAGFIFGSGLLFTLLCAVVSILFTLLLLGVNYVSMRWTGTDINNGILLLLYMVAVTIVMIPGVIAAIFIGIAAEKAAAGFGFTAAALVLGVWEIIVAVACFWASKGILHNTDIAVMKMGAK